MNKTRLLSQARRATGFLAAATALCAALSACGESPGILQIRDGYFWDPGKREYFFPRGVAYQTWNPPVGANQTLQQVDYDLTEFKKIYATSVRCELVWSQVQRGPTDYDWSRADFLVKRAEELGLRLFVLIGFQYPPEWFPAEWHGLNDRGDRSDVLNYEHPEARRAYTNFIAAAATRYKDSPAVGAWILGNEFAYFDLWEDSAAYPVHRFLGYDADSQASFRRFLRLTYGGDIQELNSRWRSAFAAFEEVEMPARYPTDRNLPSYHDLIQWRKSSIAEFVGAAAKAAKTADPDHLITYSMVGGIFSGTDANYTGEDAKEIVAACRRTGAPLDFFAVNNYAWASIGSEMRSADFGIAKYQETVGLPVLVSETGHSSTENILGPGAAERQPYALPSQLWEGLMSGAIGVHFFHWSDRNMFTTNYFLRERGFGIVGEDRIPKQHVYTNIVSLLRRMEELKVADLLAGSGPPPRDVLFYWSLAADMGWPRANQENAMIWGALKRLGYQPGILDDEGFANRRYTNAAAILLSRAYQLSPSVLQSLRTDVIPQGIHVHANADLPGEFDAYHRPDPSWLDQTEAIFGLDASGADPGWDSGATDSPAAARLVTLKSTGGFGSITPDFDASLYTWKIWHGIRARSGSTVLTHTGLDGTQTPMPALQFKDHGTARTAINTFALGDTYEAIPLRQWDDRSAILGAIYRDFFGIKPKIELRGPGSQYVIPDYRICRNGSVLLSLMNETTTVADVEVYAPALLSGKTVKDLTSGRPADRNVAGQITAHLSGDQFLLLYAYSKEADSLVRDRSEVGFGSAPAAAWPSGEPIEVTVNYSAAGGADLRVRLEEIRPVRCVRAQSAPIAVTGMGVKPIPLALPDANLADQGYTSSPDGGEYRLTAALEKSGVVVNQVSLPVRLLWSALPKGLPGQPTPGHTYQATLEWQDLPSFLPLEQNTPLGRAPNWDSLREGGQKYQLSVSLKSAGGTIASYSHVTTEGSGSRPFFIEVPASARPPLYWSASATPVLESQSVSFFDGFEGRERGAMWGDGGPRDPTLPTLTSPWVSYKYGEFSDQVQWQNEGINLEGRSGGQAAFLVVTNNSPGRWAGFGFQYNFPFPWALPEDTRQWTNFSFAGDFYERQRLPALVELQVKSAGPGNRLIHYVRQYQPDPDGWYHIEAPLDRFANFAAEGTVFDPASVGSLVINVQMLQTQSQYVAFFDNLRFTAPSEVTMLAPPISLYSSDNDRSVTLPQRSSTIRYISSPSGSYPSFSWTAAPDTPSSIYYSDEAAFPDWRLLPNASIDSVRVADDDLVTVTDLDGFASPRRFYRLVAPPLLLP